MKENIISANAPAAVGPYSQAIKLNGVLYISGQLPADPASGAFPEVVEAQTRQSLNNIASILKEASMSFDDVVKTTVLLNDIRDFGAMNAIYAEFFPNTKPARVCYQAAALPKGALVEIDAIAGK